MTTYGATAEHRLAMAQLVIDKHIQTDAGGRCTQCGEVEPCSSRQAAHLAFETYGGLPRRRQGAAAPWFDR
jgi:hypothetical protein